jgi:hypothetical protein
VAARHQFPKPWLHCAMGTCLNQMVLDACRDCMHMISQLACTLLRGLLAMGIDDVVNYDI